MTEQIPAPAASRRDRAKSWAGYGWFMSFGTLLPLPIFLVGYVAHLTFIGAPAARTAYRFGIALATLGQPPPGEERMKERTGKDHPRLRRLRQYTPPLIVERHGRPFGFLARAAWFVLVGWWLGAVWVVGAWSLLLFPYPLTDAIRSVLRELPSVMTLAKGA